MIKFYTFEGNCDSCVNFIAEKLNNDFGATNARAGVLSGNTVLFEIDDWNGKSFSQYIGGRHSTNLIWNISICGENGNELLLAYPIRLTGVNVNTSPEYVIYLIYSDGVALYGGGASVDTINNRFNISNLPSILSNNDRDCICKAFYNPNATTPAQETNLYISPLAHWNNPGIKFRCGTDFFYTIGMCFYCKSLEESA